MENSTSSKGVGLGTVLVAIFVVLKLTHVINWSWWWVFAPWWIPTIIILVVLLFGYFVSQAAQNQK